MLLSSPIDNLSLWIYAVALVLIVALAWTALRFVLKLTMKVFTLGCVGILLLALLCAGLAYFGGR